LLEVPFHENTLTARQTLNKKRKLTVNEKTAGPTALEPRAVSYRKCIPDSFEISYRFFSWAIPIQNLVLICRMQRQDFATRAQETPYNPVSKVSTINALIQGDSERRMPYSL
jgi:hypothetical protein